MRLLPALQLVLNQKKTIAIAVLTVLFASGIWGASQRRLRIGTEGIAIEGPEIAQTFYGELKGASHRYKIYADSAFRLYARVQVPGVADSNQDMSLLINYQSSPEDQPAVPITMITGQSLEWSSSFDLFSGENYLSGPTLSTGDPDKERGVEKKAGIYEIVVFSSDNYGKYILTTGDRHPLSLGETINTIRLLPQVKKFFAKSPLMLIFSIGGIFLLALSGALLTGAGLGLYKLTRVLIPIRKTQEEQYYKEPEETAEEKQ
jgi:hypothetical protein